MFIAFTRTNCGLALIIGIAAFLVPAPRARGQSLDYLGDLGGEFSLATSINDSGEVVGQAATGPGNPVPTTAFFYTPDTGMQALDSLSGTSGFINGEATGVNDSGEVVGWTQVNSQDEAFTYTSATGMQTIPGTANGGYSSANAINSSGQITGQYTPDAPTGNYASQSFIYTTASGVQSFATAYATTANAIDNAGDVAGSFSINGTSHAFVYSKTGGFQDLGLSTGYISSGASGINNQGQVVGTLGTLGTASRAFIYSSNTGIVDLGTLGGGLTSSANAINDMGDVVGESTITSVGVFQGGTMDAFIYLPGTGMEDLNVLYRSLLVSGTDSQAGFTQLIDANDINDEGQIVGEGIYYNGTTSYESAFVLDTAPEPSVTALFGLGLGILLWRGARSRSYRRGLLASDRS